MCFVCCQIICRKMLCGRGGGVGRGERKRPGGVVKSVRLSPLLGKFQNSMRISPSVHRVSTAKREMPAPRRTCPFTSGHLPRLAVGIYRAPLAGDLGGVDSSSRELFGRFHPVLFECVCFFPISKRAREQRKSTTGGVVSLLARLPPHRARRQQNTHKKKTPKGDYLASRPTRQPLMKMRALEDASGDNRREEKERNKIREKSCPPPP